MPKLQTGRPRKTKIGTEVAHVTCDSDTNFKVKGGVGILWRPPAQLVIVAVLYFFGKTVCASYLVTIVPAMPATRLSLLPNR